MDNQAQIDDRDWLRVSEETENKAKFIFAHLIDAATDPQEAATIIMLVHLHAWEHLKGDDGTVDDMLEGYCTGFKLNHELGKRSVQ
jgi:hypothetical protein